MSFSLEPGQELSTTLTNSSRISDAGCCTSFQAWRDGSSHFPSLGTHAFEVLSYDVRCSTLLLERPCERPWDHKKRERNPPVLIQAPDMWGVNSWILQAKPCPCSVLNSAELPCWAPPQSTATDHDYHKMVAILSCCVWGLCYIAIGKQDRASPDKEGFCGERNGEGSFGECLYLRGGPQHHSTPAWNSHRTKGCKKSVIRGLSTSHPHSQQCRVIWRGGGLTAGVLEMSSVSTWAVGCMNFLCHLEKAFSLVLNEQLDGAPTWGFCHRMSWTGKGPLWSYLKNGICFPRLLQPAAGKFRGWQEKALGGTRLSLAFISREILCLWEDVDFDTQSALESWAKMRNKHSSSKAVENA